MAGIYVKLDVDYASDDKVLSAGPMAELLYVRSLAFTKRTMTNGEVLEPQLALVALGIPAAKKHADTLVSVGLWDAIVGGWRVRAWLKHNKASQEIREESEQKRLASAKANHERWHVNGKRSAKCPFCDPIRTPDRMRVGVRPESTETETETETETGSSESESDAEPEPVAPPKPPQRRLTQPRHAIELVEPNGPVTVRRETYAVLDQAARNAEDPITATDRRVLWPVIEEALTAGYQPDELAAAIAASPFRTGPAVMGELRKRKQPTRKSVGDTGLTAASTWLERQEGA